MAKTNLKRVLALVLTVLMVVGVIPMAVFAVEPVDNSTPSSDYKVNNFQEMLEGAFNADSEYWSPIWVSDGISKYSTYTGKTQIKYASSYSATESYIEVNPHNGKLPISSEGDIFSMPQDTSVTTTAWGAGYAFWLTNLGTRVNWKTAKDALWANNLAGLDVAINTDIKLNSASEPGEANFWLTTQRSYSAGLTSYDTSFFQFLAIVLDENGEFSLHLTNASGAKLATLPADEYFNLQILLDVGGDDRTTAGNTFYVFVNGKLVGANTLLNSTNLKNLYDAEEAWNEENSSSHPNGFYFQSFYMRSGSVFYDLKNVGAYYYDDTPEDGDITNAKRGAAIPNIIYYNDYDALTAGSTLKGAAADASAYKGTVVTNPGTGYTDKGDSNSNDFWVVEDAVGDNALKMNATGESWYDISFGKLGNPYVANSGKSFVLQFDIKADGFNASGPLFNFGDRGRGMGNGKYETGIVPIMRDKDGSLYVGYKGGAAMYSYAVNGDDGKLKESVNNYEGYNSNPLSAANKAGGLLCKLSGDKYTNIAVFVNVAENYFTIYVDGVDKTGKLTLLNAEQKQRILDAGFTNGFAVTEARMFYNHTNKDLYLDNLFAYFGDGVVLNSIDLSTKSYKVAYTPAELQAALAASGGALGYYNSFDGVSKLNDAAIGDGQMEQRVGKQGVADGVATFSSTLDTAKNTYKYSVNTYVQKDGNNTPYAANSGKSFVYQLDLKLGDVVWAGTIGNIGCTLVPGTSVNVDPLTIDANGNILSGSTAVGKLSKDAFTTVAYAVDVKNNVYDIFIDGVEVVSDATFLTQPQIEQIAGYEGFENGFAFSYVGLYRENAGNQYNGTVFTYDNVLIYYNDSYLGMKDVTELVAYDASTDTGYKAEDGGIYYYENGVIVGNKVTPDGILTIDENGQVFYGETAVTNLLDYYQFVNGDLVPVDGVFKGNYCANILGGSNSGNLYYYDEDANRVVDQACYVIDGVPYAIDANGLRSAYTGIYSNKYYVNGEIQVNGVYEVDGEKYYAGEDGTFIEGTYKVGDGYYVFSAENDYKGVLKAAGEVVDSVTNAETGKVYETIQDAFDDAQAGDKFVLSDDIENAGNLMVSEDITLDLNGKTITADGFAILGDNVKIVTSAENKGFINVPKNNFTADEVVTTDTIVVYKDNTDDALSGYEFATVRDQKTFEENADGDGFALIFRPSLDNNTAYNQSIFGQGGAAANVTFIVRLEFADESSKEFLFSDALVKEAYATGKALKITIKGATADLGEINVKYILSSGTGMNCVIDAGSFTPTAVAE